MFPNILFSIIALYVSIVYIMEDINACKNILLVVWCAAIVILGRVASKHTNLRQLFYSIRYRQWGTELLSKFYLQNWRWVFSSTLDLNQTTAKGTTSSFFYFDYSNGILKPLIHYLYRVIIPLLLASLLFLKPLFFPSSTYSQREGFEANRGKKTMLLDCDSMCVGIA